MKIESLELLPRGENGWGSGVLRFGGITTLLLGPNGSGKTPILKALDFCLGVPVELPPEVKERCLAVAVTFMGNAGPHRIERKITQGVEATLTAPDGATTHVQDERQLSEWVFSQIGCSPRVLTAKNGALAAPYMSVAGPMFLVDQDTGWAAPYVPFEAQTFIKDQREEIIRWFLSLPPKNQPANKEEYQKAKTRQETLQGLIQVKREVIESLKRDMGEDRSADASKRLEERRFGLEESIARVSSVVANLTSAESPLQKRIRDASVRRDDIAFRLANCRRRQMQLVEIQSEVNTELEALEQNEVAAEVFRSLCGSKDCQFFRNPEETYGRRVLYLRDQLKDFESSTGQVVQEVALLAEQLAGAEAGVKDAVAAFNQTLHGNQGGEHVAAFEAASIELADICVRIDRLNRIAKLKEQFDELIKEEQRVSEDVSELRPTGSRRSDGSRLLDARQMLAKSFKGWLLTLKTPNMVGEASFDEELNLVVNGEKITSKTHFSGSTRTRLLLAFHGALVETSLGLDGEHPKVLVLDAPKQHEMSAADLRSFLERFYKLSSAHKSSVQLVFSATDPEVAPEGMIDALWEPRFETEEGLRFLGPSIDVD